MSHTPRPLRAKFWTPGVVLMAFLMAAGAVAIIARYIGGIGYVTNLTLRIGSQAVANHPALALIDVRVLDHIVVGAGEMTSLAERGLI